MTADKSCRVGELLDFFREGGSICPHARAVARANEAVVGELVGNDAAHDAAAVALVASFKDATPAAILLAPASPATHAEAEPLAEYVFGVLALALMYPDLAAPHRLHIRSKVLEDATRALHHPKLHPILALRGAPLFVFAMGPAYQREHPRYAPQLCVVVTWQADVVGATMRQPKVTDRIRAAMRDRTGVEYDAVTFYLHEEP